MSFGLSLGMNPLSQSELLLLLFFRLRTHNQYRIEGRTKTQKIIYLISRDYPPLDFGFVGYFYGPYSKELQNTLDRLVAFNLLTEDSEFVGNVRYQNKLTEMGCQLADQIWSRLDRKTKTTFNRIVHEASEYNLLPLADILPQAYEIAEREGIL